MRLEPAWDSWDKLEHMRGTCYRQRAWELPSESEKSRDRRTEAQFDQRPDGVSWWSVKHEGRSYSDCPYQSRDAVVLLRAHADRLYALAAELERLRAEVGTES